MRRLTCFALALPLALAACGGEPANETAGAEAAPVGTDAEVAADAALADEAAQAEAEDAAIGGNVTANDVSAAENVTGNGQ